MSLARVRIGCLGEEVSALGFGCASLGSRIAPAAGLAALERAYDAGVTWFDVAPSYGDGQAEALLGRFLKGKRDAVQVLTKVGIAPPAPSLRQRLVRPAMRLALGVAPGLRAAVRKRRPPATKLPLDAAMIGRSLEASLKRLGTDHVDVLALHDATPEEAARDDMIAALAQVVKAGKARTAAIASAPAACAAALSASTVCEIAQFGVNPLVPGDPVATAVAPRPAIDRVTHSAFADDAPRRLAQRIADDTRLAAALAEAGYDGPPGRIAANYCADFAFAANPNGVVLMSMFKPEHLAANIARHARPRDPAALARIAALVAQGAER